MGLICTVRNVYYNVSQPFRAREGDMVIRPKQGGRINKKLENQKYLTIRSNQQTKNDQTKTPNNNYPFINLLYKSSRGGLVRQSVSFSFNIQELDLARTEINTHIFATKYPVNTTYNRWMVVKQQYHVVPGPIGLVGLNLGFG